ncbi:Hydantoinase B/oxoprolinase [Roseovarius albus]|uniref:Hydantoinase B/oxoprolinase n=1 Tax=Roseovarius albus TaxID=1247867 RepID=A0A1X6Z749_9RHOB|nr:Hydantoinase B/oxoprolinase [Roseovarius albus]
MPLNYSTAYSVFGLRCIFAPEVPNYAGSLGCFEVTAPDEGCILNAPRPAPVAQRHVLGQIMPDLMYGCLHQAIPDRIPAEGSSNMYDLPLSGGFEMNNDQNATKYAVEVTHNGGTGARPGKDGLSVAAFPSSGLRNPVDRPQELVADDVRLGIVSAEAAELEYDVTLTASGEVDTAKTAQLRSQ